jgi:hypothetical protein
LLIRGGNLTNQQTLLLFVNPSYTLNELAGQVLSLLQFLAVKPKWQSKPVPVCGSHQLYPKQ